MGVGTMRIYVSKIAAGLTLAVWSSFAFAETFFETCHACDPGDYLDPQVEQILNSYRNVVQSGDNVIIQDDRLE